MADIQTLKKLLAEEYGITTARELDEAMKKILSEAFMADDKHIIPRRAVLCGRSLLPRGSGPVLDEHPAGSFLYHLSRGKKISVKTHDISGNVRVPDPL